MNKDARPTKWAEFRGESAPAIPARGRWPISRGSRRSIERATNVQQTGRSQGQFGKAQIRPQRVSPGRQPRMRRMIAEPNRLLRHSARADAGNVAWQGECYIGHLPRDEMKGEFLLTRFFVAEGKWEVKQKWALEERVPLEDY